MNGFTATGVLLLILCCCEYASSVSQLNLIHARLMNMLKEKQKLNFKRQIRTSLDLREHRLFQSDPQLDCCPTITEFAPRKRAINKQGLALELFNTPNFTQSFYETFCHPEIKNRPCQFIDAGIAYATRCSQQYSYVYAIARTLWAHHEQFRIDYIRVASGCKCHIVKDYLKKRKRQSN